MNASLLYYNIYNTRFLDKILKITQKLTFLIFFKVLQLFKLNKIMQSLKSKLVVRL